MLVTKPLARQPFLQDLWLLQEELIFVTGRKVYFSCTESLNPRRLSQCWGNKWKGGIFFTTWWWIHWDYLRKNTFFQLNFQALHNSIMILTNRTKIKSLRRNKMTNKWKYFCFTFCHMTSSLRSRLGISKEAAYHMISLVLTSIEGRKI